MKWPTDGRNITQKYGNRNKRYRKGYHTGVDIGVPQGTNIYAAHAGIASFVGWNGAYGNEIKIAANSMFLSSYHHLSQFKVRVGQKVTEGQVIGLSGNTGMSTGPHLHFEIRIKGKDVDPMPYLQGAKTPNPGDPNTPDPTTEGSFNSSLTSLEDWLTGRENWVRLGLFIAGGLLLILAGIRLMKNG